MHKLSCLLKLTTGIHFDTQSQQKILKIKIYPNEN